MDLRRIAIVFRQLNRVIIGRLSVMAEKVVRRDEKMKDFNHFSIYLSQRVLVQTVERIGTSR